jgi:hypothetical protein
MKTFYFNTGVTIGSLSKGQIWSSNGVKVIPFDCEDVPDNAIFLHACDTDTFPPNCPHIIKREIHNSSLRSKFAFFRIIPPVS